MFVTSRMASLARTRLSVPALRASRLLSTATPYSHMIINAVGPDRPGIVADLTKVVTDAGGSVGDSRAGRLGGHFSVMMLVSVPSGSAADLGPTVGAIAGVDASVYDTTDPDSVDVQPQVGYAGSLSLEGADSAGIVHEITSILAAHGMSVDRLDTGREGAPHGGTTLFYMNGVVTVPLPLAQKFSPDAVRKDLHALADSMNCDITVEDSPLPFLQRFVEGSSCSQ